MKRTTLYLAAALLAASLTQTALAQAYQASTADKPLKIVNLAELEAQAQQSMEKGAFGYVRGGAENERPCAKTPAASIKNTSSRASSPGWKRKTST